MNREDYSSFYSGATRIGSRPTPQDPLINAVQSLNPLAVIVVSIVAFVFGGLWFSPLLFVKPWMAEVKMTPEKAKAAGGGKSRMAGAFFFTVVSTFSLAVLIAALHTASPLRGAAIGLFVGAGLVGARAATTDLFEMRSITYFLTVTGHDVAQFALVGALLAVWR
jgi:hypothetical protein